MRSGQILFHVLLPLVLISIKTTPSLASDPYSSCSNLFSCGSIKDVGYPFWGGTRGGGCGYPDLELTCEENNVAKVVISNVRYHVLEYYPTTSGVLKISREDYSNGSLCSPNFTNTTLDPTRFDIVSGYTNFTFLYGCPSLTSNFPGQFTCRIDGVPYSTGYVEIGAFGPASGCFNSVVVPLSQTLVTNLGNNSSDGLVRSLRDGFEVRLKVDDAACKVCTQSKGVCGYDSSANRTTCYCKGQSSRSTTCSSSSSGSSKGLYLSSYLSMAELEDKLYI